MSLPSVAAAVALLLSLAACSGPAPFYTPVSANSPSVGSGFNPISGSFASP